MIYLDIPKHQNPVSVSPFLASICGRTPHQNTSEPEISRFTQKLTGKKQNLPRPNKDQVNFIDCLRKYLKVSLKILG